MIFKYLLCAVLPCLLSSANAAVVGVEPFNDAGMAIRYTGAVERGDLAKLQTAFESVKKRVATYSGDPTQTMFFLQSPGGDVNEAIAIGRWVRKIGVSVVVLPNANCHSSCVYILAAGLYRHAYGAIGIHRPYLSGIPVSGIDAAMKAALVKSRAYFAEMNVPEQLADTMFSIPPDEIQILSGSNLSSYRLNQVDMVQQEKVDLKNAAFYGLSRQEYMQRNKAYGQERLKCEHLSGIPKYECWEHARTRVGLIRK